MMMRQARNTTLLVDSTKFDLSYLSLVCPLEDLDTVVVDAPPQGALAQALVKAQVGVHVAPNKRDRATASTEEPVRVG